MNRIILVILILLQSSISFSQKATIKGTIRDKETGEALIGASVIDTKRMLGTTTNTFGFFSITLNKDSVSLMFSYVGYSSLQFKFLHTQDTSINIELEKQSMLGEVVIEAESEQAIQNSTRMGTIDLPVEQIKAMPALLGETDVLKVIQLLPGVQGGTEGSSGLYVRGGGPDQNLILLDGVPVYNASHLFGFFSVFNADAINHVELVKGGFPARYGGRLSSVIDISMKEGNMKEFKGEGSIGIISSKLTLEGPIKKDKTSFLISGRRTYIDLLTRPLIQAASDGDEVAGYYFYDLNAKINHKLNDRNRLYLSTYMGSDKAYSRYRDDYNNGSQNVRIEDEYGLRWGNITTALRWNSILSQKLFSNVTATYSRYRFNVFADFYEKVDGNGQGSEYYSKSDYISGIRDYALKVDFDFLPSPAHFVKFGAQGIRHLFTPGALSYQSNEDLPLDVGSKPIYANEFYVYAEDDVQFSNRLKSNIGLHLSAFVVNGETYNSLQPRLSLRYLINNSLSFKASYATMTQYLHLLTNAGLGLPTDLWVPVTQNVKPENSYLYAAGLAYNLSSTYEFSFESYYKKMTNLIEYKEGASFADIENDWQTKVTSGDGESYGSEFFIQKKKGKVNGWVGYTLSWNFREFPEIDQGRRFPYKFDRRHDVEVAIAWQLNERKQFGLTWVYGTGNAISLPNAIYPGMPNRYSHWQPELNYYEGRNNYRMRAYHRMDFSYSVTKKTKWGERTWTFSIYNLYNRRNPFYMDIGYDDDGNKKFVQYSLFPIIPSASMHFKF